jgi:hypothetical protein
MHLAAPDHPDRSGSAFRAPEATLVVIAGRGSGRTLLPHRHVARRYPEGARLPIVIVRPRAGR